MGFNIKSLYAKNTNDAGNTTPQKGFNVQSLRDREFELKVGDDKSFGNISYGAKQAIENNTLDSYTPKDDSEKKVLDDYKKWFVEYAMPEISSEEKEIFGKYGIDPITFDNDEFKIWAEAHNFEYRMAGNELTGKEYKWLPKQKEGFKFWETLTTKEEESDKKVLERFIEKKNIRKNATKHPVITSAITVATAPIRGIAGAVATVRDKDNVNIGKEVNTNDTAHGVVEDANLIRETVTNKHASNWFGGANGKLGNYGSLAYNGLMSIGDTVMISLTTKGIGSGMGLTGKGLASFTSNTTSGLLASNSAASTVMEKKKEGLSDDKAVANGIATAAAEFITEKISLDMIFNKPTSMLKKGLVSFLAEGSEEMTSDVLSKTADYFISGDDSSIKKSISRYMQNGMSKKDATKQAAQDSIYETLSAGLVGGLSGVAIGSAYHGFGISEIKKLGADYREVAADIVQSGLDSPKNTTAYKYADKLSKKGIDKISDYELGLLHTYNVEQIAYEQEQEEKAAKKAEKSNQKIQSKISVANNAADIAQSAENAKTPSHNVIADTYTQNSYTVEAPTDSLYAVNMPTENHYTVDVGDVFTDTYTGNTISVISRDSENTVVEIDTGTKVEHKMVTNEQADTLIAREQYEQTASAESNEPEAVSESAQPVEQKSITLTRIGDFYEAYGDEAVEIAKKLNLTPTTKAVNGMNVPVVGFPIQSLDNYKSVLGDGYSTTVADAPAVTNTNEQNMSVSGESVTDRAENTADGDISTVVDAMNETLLPGAKEAIFASMEKKGLSGDLAVFATKLKEKYERTGAIGAISHYFLDGGEKVISALDSLKSGESIKKKRKARTTEKPTRSGYDDIILPYYRNNNNNSGLSKEDISFDELRSKLTNAASLLDKAKKAKYTEAETTAAWDAFMDVARSIVSNSYSYYSDSEDIVRFKEAKSVLRNTPIYVSDYTKSGELGESYNAFHKKNFGKLRLVKDRTKGGTVTDVYESMRADYPDYFPDVVGEQEMLQQLDKFMDSDPSTRREKLYNDNDIAGIAQELMNAVGKDVSNIAAPSASEVTESGIKSDKTVTEPAETVIKKADSVTETPNTEKITVDMDDETRAELLNKKSVNVVSVDAENTKTLDNIDLDVLQNSYPSYARPIIKKIARDFGILNEPFFNPDIELEFNYSGDSIQESINKQHSRYGDFVKMLSVFSDVIENAVGVETHKDKYTGTRREDTNLKQMYVLASAFSDEKGVYPVKLEVKEFKKNTNKLYLSVVLTKKESRHLSGNLGQNQLNTAPPTSIISISDLVAIVNPTEGDFLKYFPDSMLDSEQIAGKNKALAEDAEKVEKLKAPLKNEPETIVQEEKQAPTETVEKTMPEDTAAKQNDGTSAAYDVAYFENLGSDIRKGESVSLKDVRTAVDAILLNHGEAIKAELSQLKNTELKKHLSVYDS